MTSGSRSVRRTATGRSRAVAPASRRAATLQDLLAVRAATGVIADKAYDNNALRELIDEAGCQAVIPSLSSRKVQVPHDRVAYKLRNRIERFFNRLKRFRHIATRYGRRASHFLAALRLASAMIWMR